jgi:hypothetical protein
MSTGVAFACGMMSVIFVVAVSRRAYLGAQQRRHAHARATPATHRMLAHAHIKMYAAELWTSRASISVHDRSLKQYHLHDETSALHKSARQRPTHLESGPAFA